MFERPGVRRFSISMSLNGTEAPPVVWWLVLSLREGDGVGALDAEESRQQPREMFLMSLFIVEKSLSRDAHQLSAVTQAPQFHARVVFRCPIMRGLKKGFRALLWPDQNQRVG
jgi:hypothetical protein